MNTQRLFGFLLMLLMGGEHAFSQQWMQTMRDPNANFYDVQRQFNTYWQSKAHSPSQADKAAFNLYKQWEYVMEPRVYPTGQLPNQQQVWQEYQQYTAASINLNGPSGNKLRTANNWAAMNPVQVNPPMDAGRTACVRIDPNNPGNIYCVASCGGLWNSTNGGVDWTSNTDQLGSLGMSDLAIDPTNTNNMYLATGDFDGAVVPSIGVLKSGDGGASWNSTGLNWNASQGLLISKLLINPISHAVLAATSNGVYLSKDNGVTWSKSLLGNYKNMQFKPGNPNVVYVSGTDFQVSTDGGASFSSISSGLPVPASVSRLAIAVTPADSNYVYLLEGDTTGGFAALLLSTDGGNHFSTQSTMPNLMGWASDGSDLGGQSPYTCSIAASPSNKNEIVCGGISIWKSSDAGVTWNITALWRNVAQVHGGIHDLEYVNGSTIYAGTDGGVSVSTDDGSTWTDLNKGLATGLIYGLSCAATDSNLVLSGWRDNGINLYASGISKKVWGGDGTRCIIDYTNSAYLYASSPNGILVRSTDGGTTFLSIMGTNPNYINETGGWVIPFVMDPHDPKTIYAGYDNVWKTTDRGDNWSPISTLGTGSMVALAIASSATIYAARSHNVYKTSNGGKTWTDITGTLPVANASITYLAVNPSDSNKVFITFSGYVSGQKVYTSADGGTTWVNTSSGLPNLPINCIVYQNGTNDYVYVGSDIGVYFKNSSMNNWQAFFNGLPNAKVEELQIQYASGKIRAATYGRGLWQSDLHATSSPPTAQFTADHTVGCAGLSVQFTDQSLNQPDTWNWSFPGGTPSSSNIQNPLVVYNTPGTFNVKLMVSMAGGNDSVTKSNYIITSSQSLPLSESFEGKAFPPANWSLNTVYPDQGWSRDSVLGANGSGLACAVFNNYATVVKGHDALNTPNYDFSGISAALLTFDVAYARYDKSNFDSLVVAYSLDCGASFNRIYAKGGSSLATAPDDGINAFVPTNSQWRNEQLNLSALAGKPSVIISFININGWGQRLYIDNVNITAVTDVNETTVSSSFELYPNPGSGDLYTEVTLEKREDLLIHIYNIMGQEVLQLKQSNTLGGKFKLNLTDQPNGFYYVECIRGDQSTTKKIIINR